MDKKKRIFLILCAVYILLLVGASVLYIRLETQWAQENMLVQNPTTQPTQASAIAGDTTPTTTQALATAPDFTVYDSEGNPVKLSDFFGKPIVLNFWASWCGPCQSEMPDFQAKYDALNGEVQFLMVNMTYGRETLESAKAFLQDKGYTFPVFYDTEANAAYAYSVYYLPTTYFIDDQGNAIAMVTSALSADLLQQGIDMITGEE